MKELRQKDKWGRGKPSVMIFDVNETLIDFQSLNPLFKASRPFSMPSRIAE
jgi:hypothetical protein